MENENKDSLLTQKVIECLELLEQSGTYGQAELKEKLKQFLLGRNTDVEEEVEDATQLYFRVGGLVCNTNSGFIDHDFKWFVRGQKTPLFQEPNLTSGKKPREARRYTPLAVGPHIFLISDVMHGSTPRRDVRYHNTQKNEEGWLSVSPMVGEHARACHFVVAADDKIYAFGFVDNGDSLRVSSFDCQKPDQEWKVKANATNGGPPIQKGLFHCLLCLVASTIQYDTTTTVEGKPGRCARRALLFANWCRITYDFEANSYVLLKEWLSWEPWCGVCPDDGSEIYILIQDLGVGDSVSIKVCNYDEMEYGMTTVLGLDKYLPEAYEHSFHPRSRLVPLGNKRLCLVDALYPDGNTEVRCTKFSVRVQQDGEYHATNVSSLVYKLNDSPDSNYEFDVVAV